MVEDCLDVAYKTEIEAKVVPHKCHKSILSISQYSAHSALRVEDFNGPSSVNGCITFPLDFTYKIENAPRLKSLKWWLMWILANWSKACPISQNHYFPHYYVYNSQDTDEDFKSMIGLVSGLVNGLIIMTQPQWTQFIRIVQPIPLQLHHWYHYDGWVSYLSVVYLHWKWLKWRLLTLEIMASLDGPLLRLNELTNDF